MAHPTGSASNRLCLNKTYLSKTSKSVQVDFARSHRKQYVKFAGVTQWWEAFLLSFDLSRICSTLKSKILTWFSIMSRPPDMFLFSSVTHSLRQSCKNHWGKSSAKGHFSCYQPSTKAACFEIIRRNIWWEFSRSLVVSPETVCVCFCLY